MLKLYAGRENIDKERFIYESISQLGGETLVIVPDQYTLVAEEQALRYMGSDCLFDTEILSMNRLGMRILAESGSEKVTMLDKYGRFMLLSRIIREHQEDFDIFRRSAGKLSFARMLGDFISEFKQNDCTLSEVEALLESEDVDPMLRAKLLELSGVIEAYEKAISGRYADAEDYIDRYIRAIPGSRLLEGKTIWVYGYDSITPKFTNALLMLARRADTVNFIVNRSDFLLDEQMVAMLMRMGSEEGIEVSCEEIGQEYTQPKSETVQRIERGLWKNRLSAEELLSNAEFMPDDLVMVSAANPYSEAESAAAYVWHLVRDLGYRMKDIQIIANDEATMQPIIRRVFSEYGLPVFMDSSRNITDTAPVAFIVNLLWFLAYNKNSQYLFAMLKTGLAGSSEDAAEDATEDTTEDATEGTAGMFERRVEELENYVRSYHIRGSMWDRPFRYGADSVGEDKFRELEELRADIMKRIAKLEDIIGSGSSRQEDAPSDDSAGGEVSESAGITVREFVSKFKAHLNDVWDLESRTEAAAVEEENAGYNDEAQRTRQSLERALELMDQVAEIIGETELDLTEFTELYAAGLSNVEVGIIPPAADGLAAGTMIRTRPRPIRAAVIVGANEGTLPLQPSPEGLFSVDENDYFRSKGFALGSLDELRMTEENQAMYRMLAKPSEKLYISWSMSDTEGNEASPSSVIESLKMLFPRIEKDGLIRKDIIAEGWPDEAALAGDGCDLISSPGESMRHLMTHIKDRNAENRSDALTHALLKWFRDNRRGSLDTMMKAARDENVPSPLGRDTAGPLFGRGDGTLVLSASSISSYFDCPFKYYVDRGLRPREEREFTGDSRSIGDAYHECLMAVARRLMADKGSEGLHITDDTAAAEVDLAAVDRMVEEELDRIAAEYRGGIFISTGNEDFHMDRIREICAGAARAMAVQLSAGSVLAADFEEGFRRGGKFQPVTLEVDGQKVYVEGKIDRSDVLSVDGGERIRIIDYKTGSDKLDLWKMRNGYKMQLMIYLISAASGGMEPAGMFYFNIKDPIESIDSKSDKQAEDLMSREPEDIYKLRGRYIDDPGVLSSMPAEVLASARSEKDRSMTREEYEAVRNDVLGQIEKTASGILRGSIDIRPFKESGRLVCSYCSYKPICRRDREYPKNHSREIPPASRDAGK